MTSPYLDRPLRTLAQAMDDHDREEARRRLKPLGIEPVDHFVAERTVLNPPPAWMLPRADEDDEGSLIGDERLLVGIAWGAAFTAGVMIAGGLVALVSG